MGLRINTNIASVKAQRNLSNVNDKAAKSFQRLSSGERIVNAGDDAAGLALANNFEAQVRGIRQATRNASDGISTVQVAEGGMSEVSNILIRLRELTVQSATDTLSDNERQFLDTEVQALKEEVNRISDVTQFNGKSLLNGEGESLQFQVGTFASEENQILYDSGRANVRTDEIGVDDVSISTRDDALDNMEVIDEAINTLSDKRSGLGALQNRLQSTVRNLRIADENMTAARSRIADVDVASESANMVKNQILQQAGVAVISQANSSQLGALRLIG
jgi:flagellin